MRALAMAARSHGKPFWTKLKTDSLCILTHMALADRPRSDDCRPTTSCAGWQPRGQVHEHNWPYNGNLRSLGMVPQPIDITDVLENRIKHPKILLENPDLIGYNSLIGSTL
jgi:hypothetical protein